MPQNAHIEGDEDVFRNMLNSPTMQEAAKKAEQKVFRKWKNEESPVKREALWTECKTIGKAPQTLLNALYPTKAQQSEDKEFD